MEFYGLVALSRLGMNAMNTAVLFLFGALLVIVIDGGVVGKLSRKFSERWLILTGLGLSVWG